MINQTPCVRCSFVYPFEGTADEIAWTLRRTKGLCPQCVASDLRKKHARECLEGDSGAFAPDPGEEEEAA